VLERHLDKHSSAALKRKRKVSHTHLEEDTRIALNLI
jgi:hypothetical protein